MPRPSTSAVRAGISPSSRSTAPPFSHDLMESEIFGHVKGSFTGAQGDRKGAASLADGGTLFLDEILRDGSRPAEQAAALHPDRYPAAGRQRQGGESVDVRFVCATNRDPLVEVKAGRFREDLYYRLHVIPLSLPPLRERGEDILLLARDLLLRYAKEEHKRFKDFDADTVRILLDYPWPGNVRELQNVVRNIVVLNDRELVSKDILPPPLNGGRAPSCGRPPRRGNHRAPDRAGMADPAACVPALAGGEGGHRAGHRQL